jgi:lipopolysaccharide biosynthesis protein
VLAFSSRFGRRREEHGPRLITVLVETEERRVSLVWQSVLRVSAEQADYLDETEIVEVRSTA